MKKLFITSCTFLLLIIACKKEENTTTGSLELTSTNISGKYKTTAGTITPSGSSLAFDFYNVDAYYAPCKRDDLHTFTAAGTYNYADSGVYCTTPPIGKTGTYTLVAPNQLTFDGRAYLVESLTTTNLVIGYDSTGFGKVKLTLTKQP
jgi:hypothetical protein